jgi:D-glycero-D-manno-heptose 1,7-bisphosphate phosphatase
LIDRDGVINRKASQGKYISKWENFEWIPETHQAMKELAQEGFQFIVITNQAGIARGVIDPVELERIHQNMREKLQKDCIQILGIYCCPHHWNEKCVCRKPNPGMLFQASKEHLFRLDKTMFIGDDPRDCQTAWRAGCCSVFLGDASELTNFTGNVKPEFIESGLTNSLGFIRKYFNQFS